MIRIQQTYEQMLKESEKGPSSIYEVTLIKKPTTSMITEI